jgi:hypothetical protein
LVLTTLDHVNLYGPKIETPGLRKDPIFTPKMTQIRRVDDFHKIRIEILCDGEITFKSSVPILLTHGLIRIAAARTHIDLLDPITTTELAKCPRMTMIEMFVTDEYVIEFG